MSSTAKSLKQQLAARRRAVLAASAANTITNTAGGGGVELLPPRRVGKMFYPALRATPSATPAQDLVQAERNAIEWVFAHMMRSSIYPGPYVSSAHLFTRYVVCMNPQLKRQLHCYTSENTHDAPDVYHPGRPELARQLFDDIRPELWHADVKGMPSRINKKELCQILYRNSHRPDKRVILLEWVGYAVIREIALCGAGSYLDFTIRPEVLTFGMDAMRRYIDQVDGQDYVASGARSFLQAIEGGGRDIETLIGAYVSSTLDLPSKKRIRDDEEAEDSAKRARV